MSRAQYLPPSSKIDDGKSSVLDMALPERRNTILTFIVDDYISSAVPVSSSTVAKSGTFNVSSATIRNEMGVLIDEGYLLRPHTSSGAIPSEKGYRHFVGGLDFSSPPPDGLVSALKGQMDVTPDDIREGLFGIINMFMSDPQFQGQTKDKLNNPSARSLVASTIRIALEQFLNTHPTASDAIGIRVLQSARARQASRAAARSARSKARRNRRLTLPGKLADCSSMDPAEGELFIVEGDSAGGSAKQGRDRKTQAVLPLRGKVLNAEQATTKKLLDNAELSNVVQALGCGLGKTLELDKLRYHKVILLMDADSDGHHIATLLLTFLYRYMRPLIDQGHVFVAEPPLYRLDAGKETHWALDETERHQIEQRLRRKNPRIKIDVQRFKGLGEMMPKTLKETTLDPARRRLLKITIPEKTRAETTISGLMGRDASVRYRFIMENAYLAEDLDV